MSLPEVEALPLPDSEELVELGAGAGAGAGVELVVGFGAEVVDGEGLKVVDGGGGGGTAELLVLWEEEVVLGLGLNFVLDGEVVGEDVFEIIEDVALAEIDEEVEIVGVLEIEGVGGVDGTAIAGWVTFDGLDDWLGADRALKELSDMLLREERGGDIPRCRSTSLRHNCSHISC